MSPVAKTFFVQINSCSVTLTKLFQISCEECYKHCVWFNKTIWSEELKGVIPFEVDIKLRYDINNTIVGLTAIHPFIDLGGSHSQHSQRTITSDLKFSDPSDASR